MLKTKPHPQNRLETATIGIWKLAPLLTAYRNHSLQAQKKLTIGSTLVKCKGAGVQAPPAFTWEQSTWVFVGVFSTMLMLTNLNDALATIYGVENAFALA